MFKVKVMMGTIFLAGRHIFANTVERNVYLNSILHCILFTIWFQAKRLSRALPGTRRVIEIWLLDEYLKDIKMFKEY